MYELSKKILQQVSFDRGLFKKELKKAIKWIKEEEVDLLKAWCIDNFGNNYRDIINEVFRTNRSIPLSA